MAAATSLLRSSSLRTAASRLAAPCRQTPRLLPNQRPPSAAATRFLRCPVELSSCVESLLPMHSATASARMNSLLSFSLRGYGWLSQAGSDDM